MERGVATSKEEVVARQTGERERGAQTDQNFMRLNVLIVSRLWPRGPDTDTPGRK